MTLRLVICLDRASRDIDSFHLKGRSDSSRLPQNRKCGYPGQTGDYYRTPDRRDECLTEKSAFELERKKRVSSLGDRVERGQGDRDSQPGGRRMGRGANLRLLF